jgi:S1-C subfamily serine protease
MKRRCICAALLLFAALMSPAFAEKRVALVVGNGAYTYVPRLTNPANDARLMSETLRSLGFTLVGGGAQLDLDIDQFRHAMQDFGNALQGADVGLFYYAGHGVQVHGANYLVPVGANPSRESDVDLQMLDSNVVLRQMEGAGTKLSMMLLDACRNNPFGGRGLRATSAGLAQMQAPEGTLISFATQPGTVAQDGVDSNSPYTKALVQAMKKPGIDVLRTFNEVGVTVASATGHAQEPWVSFSPLTGEFYFSGAPAPNGADPCALAADHWRSVQSINTLAAYQDHLARFPGCAFAGLARQRIEVLGMLSNLSPSTTPAAVDPLAKAGSGIDTIVEIMNPAAPAAPTPNQTTPSPRRIFGIIVDPAGLIVTLSHSLSEATNDVTVALSDGTQLHATLFGRDSRADLALLRVTPDRPLKALRWASTSALSVGQKVAAFVPASTGRLEPKAVNIVALEIDARTGPYDALIESDTAPQIGTPLLNPDGDVLGINTYELGSNGHALATPSEQVSWVVGQLKDFGLVRRGWLGVQIQPVTKEVADALNTRPSGALVSSVTDKGPAKTGGVEEGDIITAIDGRNVKDARELARAIGMASPSQIVQLSIVRRGNEMKKAVTLGLLPQPAGAPASSSAQGATRTAEATNQAGLPPPASTTKIVGLGIVDLDDKLRASYRIASSATGVLVVTSDFGSTDKRMMAGDLIVEVSGSPVANVTDFRKDIDVLRASGKKTIVLRVNRDGGSRFVALNIQ